jgi:hypothetical protein
MASPRRFLKPRLQLTHPAALQDHPSSADAALFKLLPLHQK